MTDAESHLRTVCFDLSKARGFPRCSVPDRRGEAVFAGEPAWELFTSCALIDDVVDVAFAIEATSA